MGAQGSPNNARSRREFALECLLLVSKVTRELTSGKTRNLLVRLLPLGALRMPRYVQLQVSSVKISLWYEHTSIILLV